MADKPRNPRRAGGTPRRSPRSVGGDPPGNAPPRGSNQSERPARGSVRTRTIAGINAQSLELLEREGLLTGAGRRLKAGPATAKGPAKQATKPVSKPRRHTSAESAVAERLHKVMAQAGLASRRHSEELIQAGRVTVNGQVVTELGSKVIPGKDIVEVDGRPLAQPESLVYILLNKPKGYMTTLYDPQGRPKVVDLLGNEVAERVYPVGRLDYDTEGLLLLTNDGELAHALMHPAKQVKKTYIAKVRGVPGSGKIKQLESGVELDDGMTAPAEVKLLEVAGPNAATLSLRIHEGRNRQVRRMFEAVGHEVIHLKRTAFGPLHLKSQAVGEWRELTQAEVHDLRRAAGLKSLSPRIELPGPPLARARRGGARTQRPTPQAKNLMRRNKKGV